MLTQTHILQKTIKNDTKWTSIFNAAKIRILTFICFLGWTFTKNLPKKKNFNALKTQVKLFKNPCKFNLYFSFQISDIDNRSCRKLPFSFCLLLTFSPWQLTEDFQVAQRRPENCLLVEKTCFLKKTRIHWLDQQLVRKQLDIMPAKASYSHGHSIENIRAALPWI